MSQNLERLRLIKSFPSLVKYLRDELDWPIESDDVEDLTFEYEAEELGLDAKTAAKIKEIKQLRPFVTGQPWGIFYINFEPKQLPVVALRRILSKLVLNKRESGNKAQQASWLLNDLLFISSYGESDERAISFAHFSEDKMFGDLPTLRVLGWDSQDTVLRLEDVEQTLNNKLRWPEDESNLEDWRKSWSSAFTLRPREVIRTSKELAIKLADLATLIRARVNQLLAIESDKGPLRKLLKAFQEALIHDLDEDGFADMYAQTIAYGLLTARVSRPAGLVADNIHDLPNTNPFLKEQLEAFLTVGGRKGKIDFDELGVNEVVELLRNANMEAVLKDFGDRNPQEDPVIHFYELFLKEYDPEKRMKRGVFYTPRPVVSFIVRSVDEILRTDFKLQDGLADTTTWSEMAKRREGLAIPQGVKPDEPFVQILDPATGTGTFLVEVIDLIYRTLRAKWTSEKRSAREMDELWNEYVPQHLLPRLHGFELMMAPYAIAHMKIGLKLRETHYSFRSSERARIYLTNTLEEPKDFSSYFEQMAPALAHEAQAANKIKRGTPITVVIGNPPYSNRGMLNKNPWILEQLEDYKEGLDEQKLNLDDDFIKFVRYGQWLIDSTGTGVLAFISSNIYMDGVTHRRMRQSLIETFNKIFVVDLHGSSKRKERCPDSSRDENVFDIQQGVAIGIFNKTTNSPKGCDVQHADVWGTREKKYLDLLSLDLNKYRWNHLLNVDQTSCLGSFYFFTPMGFTNIDEYCNGWKVKDIFNVHQNAIKTDRDELFVDLDESRLQSRMKVFYSEEGLSPEFRQTYRVEASTSYNLLSRRSSTSLDLRNIRRCLYRPFDGRYLYYSPKLTSRPAWDVMQHMREGLNLSLLSTRQITSFDFAHVLCTRRLAEIKVCSHDRATNFSPLYLYDSVSLLRSGQGKAPENDRRANISHRLTAELSRKLGLVFIADGRGDLVRTFGPEDVFHYIYAVLHSPSYRDRYAEFLKIDFPRIPLTSGVALLSKLCALGADLVALHLLEEDYEAASWNTSQPKGKSPIKPPITRFVGRGDAEVTKGHPKHKDGNVYINHSRYFEGVPEEVWNFHIGGYQVCEKWLKDRRGRTLSDEDINHYQRVVVALNETIRLMTEIDRVIEEHGGWPLAGSLDAPKAEAASGLPFA